VTIGKLADPVIGLGGLPGSYTAMTVLKSIYSLLDGTLAVNVGTPTILGITNPVTVAQATAANLKVDLSGTGANGTALKVDGSAVTQPVSGNVGGKTFVLAVAPTITATAYTAGYTVGAIQTLTNAVTVSSGTGILESLIITDTGNQKAPFDIFIFSSNPAAATTTDHAAFTFSTDITKVIARVSVATGEYASVGSTPYAIAVKSGLGIAVKASGSANLYAVAVTSGTPTFGGTSTLNFTWGILQD
jgi:hypothetical protein